MTPSQQVQAFLDAMAADGFRYAPEFADWMLQYALSDDSNVIDAHDAMVKILRQQHLTPRAKARLVIPILIKHIKSFPLAEH